MDDNEGCAIALHCQSLLFRCQFVTISKTRYKEDWDDGREGRASGYYRYRDDPRYRDDDLRYRDDPRYRDDSRCLLLNVDTIS